MQMSKFLLAVAAAAMILSAPLIAQEAAEEKSNIFTVSTYQWPFSNLEEIFAIMEENQELVEQNEYIVSRKVLTHNWGGKFSVMIIAEYASWADIEKAQDRDDELFEAKYPDEEDRKARGEKFTALAGHGAHTDNILSENAKLSK